MHTKCIQIVYKMYNTFRQTFVYILYTKLKELWQLILHTKCIQKFTENVVYKHFLYILYTSILIYKKCLHHKNYVYNLYTKFRENVYTNNCMQNGFHISTYFDLFVVHFLAS